MPSELYCRVGGINKFGVIQVIEPEKVETIEYKKGLYSPILLTPEILEKAGFKREGMTFYDNGEIYLKYQITGETPGWHLTGEETKKTFGRPLKYVHQLQNLYFALIGKELEINL